MDLVHLKKRFEENMQRHADVRWEQVEARLLAHPEAADALEWMEATGGEPDVIILDGGRMCFADCAPESPTGRRSLCYDEAARKSRKKNAPEDSCMEQAEHHGLALMTQAQYQQLQTVGVFDRKTSSWIATPQQIRALGGALFCERRYETVFVFHNGADSYYGVRGWRGVLEI